MSHPFKDHHPVSYSPEQDSIIFPKIRRSSSKRSSNENILSGLYHPSKRTTSSNSLTHCREPIFKNIKHYTSRKLRACSTTTSENSLKLNTSPKMVEARISSSRSTLDLYSEPTTPSRTPNLFHDDTPKSFWENSPITPSDTCQFNLGTPLSPLDPVSRKLFPIDDLKETEELKFAELSLNPKPHRIFEIPEILSQILEIHDLQNSYIPHEQPPVRRIPLSYEHALLIHKDEKIAEKVWQDSKDLVSGKMDGSVKSVRALSSCLSVNKLWNRVSSEIIMRNCYFDDETKWLKFASNINTQVRNNQFTRHPSPKTFVLHKVTHAKQRHFDLVSGVHDFKHLQWLELYICPKILPNPRMFTPNLKKLIITGSKVLDDDFLVQIAPQMPNLEVLDLRACELITDAGIYSIAKHCPKLKLLNVGRHTRGELVSDASICPLIRNTQISTLGVAGCGITDRTIWELAINRANDLERLSLNKCWRLTNESLPKTIKFFKKLTVLEIRHCLQINDVRPIVEYKRLQNGHKIKVLVEGCETIEKLISKEELDLDLSISKNILKDITEWCNSPSDVE